MDLVSQTEHKTRLKFQSTPNCPQRKYLPWHVVFDITKPKFLMASQIRETFLLHILLQDFQPNLLGYKKTMISSVAFNSAWEFRVMCFWLRKCDGHRISKKVVSHLRPSSATSGLTSSHAKNWTNWGSDEPWYGCTMLSSSLLTLLYCALKLSFTACQGSFAPIALFHISIQGNATNSSWEHHTYHTPAPSGWSSLWVQGWHSVAHWAKLRGGENSKSSASLPFFTGPVNKYL